MKWRLRTFLEDPSGPREIREIHRRMCRKHGHFAHWDETYAMCQVITLEIEAGVAAIQEPDSFDEDS